MDSHIGSDGFDALAVENALMDAFDLVRLNNPAIEDAQLIAGFFLVIAADRGVAIDLPASNKEACPHRPGGSLRQKRPVVALERSNNPKELVMSELIQSESTPQIRPLQEDEVNAVSGGFLPLAILAFAIGFDAGFIVFEQGAARSGRLCDQARGDRVESQWAAHRHDRHPVDRQRAPAGRAARPGAGKESVRARARQSATAGARDLRTGPTSALAP